MTADFADASSNPSPSVTDAPSRMATNSGNIADASVHTLSSWLVAGELSAVEVLDAITARIEEREPQLRAFTALSLPHAREEALASDARRRTGTTRGPLDGIPYAVKDLFDVAGESTRAGSQHRPAPATIDSAAESWPVASQELRVWTDASAMSPELLAMRAGASVVEG